MSTDSSGKSIGLRIYQEFCRMFPTAIGTVNPVELSPFLMTMRLIKQFYGFSKPEVYATLIAILQDYDPSLGVKHRERTMHYIKLLLVDQPDLAAYLLYLLPESVRSSDNEERLQQQQQPPRGSHFSAQTVKCEKKPTVESCREETSHTGSLLQRVVVLPCSESYQDFSSNAVRIAPAVNPAAMVTSTANSLLAFGKSSSIAFPHLVKNASGQVKRLQVQSKPSTLSTLLYSPNVVIKSEPLTDAPTSIVTLPRISSTLASTTIPISAVQNAGNPLTRHLGLRLPIHITASPKDSTSKAASSSSGKAPLFITAPRTVLDSSGSSRASDLSLDDRLQNIIKRFGKETTQTSAGRVTSTHEQTAVKSFVPSSLLYPKLSCVRSNDAKETFVVQKQSEFIGRSAHSSVASSLVRCLPTFPQSQPMFLIEKTSRNITTSASDSAGIRIVKKSKASTGELPLTKFDKQPATAAESSPLLSLKKLVAGVGLAKSFDRSPTVTSNHDAALNTKVMCDKLQGESFRDKENSRAKEAGEQATATSSSQNILDHTTLKVQENKTKRNEDNLKPVFESCFDKEVCLPVCSAEAEGRLSPYSDETSHSLLMNDGTSDYHVSDEEEAVPTEASTRDEIKVNKCSLSGSQSNATLSFGFDAQLSNQEPARKKARVTTSTGDNLPYEGSTYLARLMELPSPPTYGRDHPWDLITANRKRKGKGAAKRKRKK